MLPCVCPTLLPFRTPLEGKYQKLEGPGSSRDNLSQEDLFLDSLPSSPRVGGLGPTLGVESSLLLKGQAEINQSRVTEPVIRVHGKEAGVPVCRQRSQSTQGGRALSAKKVPAGPKGPQRKGVKEE